MIGAFAAGLIIWYGVAAKCLNSVSAKTFCGICIFISEYIPRVSQGVGLYLKQTQDG